MSTGREGPAREGQHTTRQSPNATGDPACVLDRQTMETESRSAVAWGWGEEGKEAAIAQHSGDKVF